MMGETATTSINKENTFAFSFTSNRSRTIALAATIPTQPPKACKRLSHDQCIHRWCKKHSQWKPAEMQSPVYKGFFLPKRSSNGPYNNCPKEIPIKKLDNESVTCATVVCRPLAMSGNAGRYISIENGPIAVSKPNMRMR